MDKLLREIKTAAALAEIRRIARDLADEVAYGSPERAIGLIHEMADVIAEAKLPLHMLVGVSRRHTPAVRAAFIQEYGKRRGKDIAIGAWELTLAHLLTILGYSKI